MYYIALAENAHDSCITIANDQKIILHLELERFFNIKRYKLKSVDTLSALLSIIFKDYSIEGNVQFIYSRHNGEKLYSETINFVREHFPKTEIYEVEHLDCHAAFSYISGFKDALVIAFDGGGDRRIILNEPNFLVYHYKNNYLYPIDTIHKPAFDGRVWNIIASKLFKDFYGAGKVMGMAAYGSFSSKYQEILLSDKFLHFDSIWNEEKLEKLLKLLDVSDFQDAACLAHTLQSAFTENLIKTISKYRHYSDNLVLTGGCALNVISNSEIGEQLNYSNVYVPPCPGDEGQSLGALLHFFNSSRIQVDYSEIPYLGQGNEGNQQISNDDYESIVSLMLSNKTLAWHMGRSEIGPRALGHRSILASPTNIDVKTVISEKIKRREFFRPVAPIVLQEYALDWFDFKFSSPYMSFSAKAKSNTKEEAPAIVHADGTSRIQTLSYKSNPEVYELISRIYDRTGIPILINTSLNIAGLPICNIEQNSKDFFSLTSIDALNLNGCLYVK